MRDAVDLIGKPIIVKNKQYTINNVYFLKSPVRPNNHIWFGLKYEGAILNYPLEDLLPYLQEQIK